MARKVFSRDQLKLLHQGHFNNLYSVQTSAGPREMLAHRADKSNLTAAKMMVISLAQGATLRQSNTTQKDLGSLCETIFRTGLENWNVLVLAADRPVTYFKYPPEVVIRENYQLEFPGGVSEGDETSLETALREAVEEYGLDDERDIIQHAPLVTFPAANDAGSNAELYTARVALTAREPHPPKREGIIPEKCWVGPLTKVQSYLERQGHHGIVVEWLTLAMISMLGLSLHGGWDDQIMADHQRLVHSRI